MMFTARVAVAPGRGRLVRGPSFVLFIPDHDAHHGLVRSALDAPSASVADAVIEYVLDQPADAPSFVFVEWPTSDTDRLRMVVRGDASLTSDLASLPELSGAGSSTWVEHQAPRHPASALLRSGEQAPSDTVLAAGVVPAGGFEITLGRDSDAEGIPPDDSDRSTTEAVRLADTPVAATRPSTSDRTGPVPTSSPGLDALLANSDANWMEESLQLDRAAPPPPEPPEPPEREVEPTVGRAAPMSNDLSPSASADELPNGGPTRGRRPSGPPRFPGDPAAVSVPTDERFPEGPDSDVTLAPQQRPGASPAPDGTGPVVQARLCPLDHPNPPEGTRCRRCGDTLDGSTGLVTVEQPALAEIVLPDGSRRPLSGAVVIGRRPTTTDAHLDDRAGRPPEMIPIDAPASVSRTHLIIAVDGWQLFATDCDSSGGTALSPSGASELVALDPWIAHELDGGDRLYLGGPTTIEVLDMPGMESS